jgi:hypothetical protein
LDESSRAITMKARREALRVWVIVREIVGGLVVEGKMIRGLYRRM